MSSDGSRHLDEHQITAFVDGNLAPAERAAITAHLESCAQCRDEVSAVVRVLRDAPVLQVTVARARRWPIRAGAGLALAAGLAAVILVATPERERDAVTRDAGGASTTEARAEIRVISPAEEVTGTRTGIVFTWQPARAGSYRFTLTTAEGAPLLTRETTDTTVVLPDTVSLEPGRLYFWNVAAIGDGIVASSGTQRLTISPR
jgi:hypothetical protein